MLSSHRLGTAVCLACCVHAPPPPPAPLFDFNLHHSWVSSYVVRTDPHTSRTPRLPLVYLFPVQHPVRIKHRIEYVPFAPLIYCMFLLVFLLLFSASRSLPFLSFFSFSSRNLKFTSTQETENRLGGLVPLNKSTTYHRSVGYLV